jgi:hypothetical protein
MRKFPNTASPWVDNTMGDINLKNSVCECDLGVFIDGNLTFDTQIAETVKKANRILGLIKRNFQYLTANCLLLLYKTLVRSILEYAQLVWNPHLRKHINQLE